VLVLVLRYIQQFMVCLVSFVYIDLVDIVMVMSVAQPVNIAKDLSAIL